MTPSAFFMLVFFGVVSAPVLSLLLAGGGFAEVKEFIGFTYNMAFAVFYHSVIFGTREGRIWPPQELIESDPWIVWLSIPLILYHFWMIPSLNPSRLRLRRKWNPTFKRHK
ncbi:hypothetical protein [Pseudomonas xanthosomatis]|uniref:hypothetical protein n=1 Tax=Pseudomonas xanthosomatis TaxID=2842356 RepID=UPI0035197BCF